MVGSNGQFASTFSKVDPNTSFQERAVLRWVAKGKAGFVGLEGLAGKWSTGEENGNRVRRGGRQTERVVVASA